MCSQSAECHPTCPSHCCKRDFDEEISDNDDDEDITVIWKRPFIACRYFSRLKLTKIVDLYIDGGWAC